MRHFSRPAKCEFASTNFAKVAILSKDSAKGGSKKFVTLLKMGRLNKMKVNLGYNCESRYHFANQISSPTCDNISLSSLASPSNKLFIDGDPDLSLTGKIKSS